MKLKKLASLALAGALTLGLLPALSSPALATDGDTNTYTIDIPSALTVTKTGWNDQTAGIKESGTLADGKKLTVTATSPTNNFNLKSGDNSVAYKLAAESEKEKSYSDATAKTTWEFSKDDLAASGGKTETVGVILEDITNKPAGTYTDTVTFTAKVEDSATDLSTLTADYVAQDGETLTGALAANVKISIADGATVTLKDATITNLENNCNWAGINCPGNAKLILKGTNTVCAGRDGSDKNNYPGIWIAPNMTLTIDGDGSLTAYSNATQPWGAGIGGGYNVACGNIVINNGNITATGGRSAGIGAGNYGNCGNITINGGTITATGGASSAGIGGSNDYGDGWGNITINGGTITAIGGEYGAGIGAGPSNNGCTSSITINGGTITATGGAYAAGIGGGSGGGYNSPSCGNITILNAVTKVTATKDSGANDCIGSGGAENSCGTVTIGGTVYYSDGKGDEPEGYNNDGETYLTTNSLIYP